MITLALSKGRIFDDSLPLLAAAGFAAAARARWREAGRPR